MAPGPHDPRSQEWPADDDDVHDDGVPNAASQRPPESPPTIQHSPPAPADDETRGLSMASPWMLPPFAAPTPDDAEPPRPRPEGLGAERRRPYPQPYAPQPPPQSSSRSGEERGTEQGRPRLVDRPDLLVASGPAPERRGRRRAGRPDLLVAQGPPREPDPPPEDSATESPAVQTAPEPVPGPEWPAEEDFEPVRRVGSPPGGRPARPDLLVAEGPPGRRGPNGGRHHRAATAPSAVRRSSPVRRRRGRGLVVPMLMVVLLTVAVGGGLVLWGWVSSPFATGLRLVGDEVSSGDDNFVAQAGVGGNGSNQVLNAVASVGSVMVAVGSDTTSPVPRPLFLVSSDGGTTWRLGKVTGPGGYETGPATVGRVAGGDGRWLAAGNDPQGSGHGLWTSSDGHDWTAVEVGDSAPFGPADKIMDLARTGSGFVAVGTAPLEDGTAGAAAWLSADGRDWERVESGQLGPPDKVRGIKAVVARGDAVVALADQGQGQSASVILRSADGGRTWRRTGAAPGDVRPEPGALASAAKGFVLVPTRQRSDKGEVSVYCSSEGADWKACGAITGLDRDASGVRRLASSSAGIAAVVDAGFERYTVHTSSDGRDWSRPTDLGEIPGSLRALAMSDAGTLVIAGDERAADVDNRVVLITAPRGGEPRQVPLGGIEGLARAARETARVAAGDGEFVAVGAVSGDAGIWSSADGQNWKAAGPAQLLGGPRRQLLSDVAYGRRGWLAVGNAEVDASSVESLLLTSADGESWRRVPVVGPLAAGPDHALLAPHAVAAGPSGYVIAGEDHGPAATVPVLWFSADLKRYSRADRLPAGGTGVRLHDVSATSSGYVAVGGAGVGERETGVVWVSADGTDWTARKPVLPRGARSAGLRHVVLYGGYVVVAGIATTEDGKKAFGAVSADNGTSWEFSWLPADSAAEVQDLAATTEGVVAVGWHGVPGAGDSAAWTSEDGLHWQRHTPGNGGLDGEGVQRLGAVAVSGDQVVALGRSTTYSADHLTLWRSTLTSTR